MSDDTKLMTADDIKDIQIFDMPSNVPPEAQAAIAMRAFGVPFRTIAEVLGLKGVSTVQHYINRYDPAGVADTADTARKLVMGSMMHGIMFKLLKNIASKQDEIEKLGIVDTIKVIKDCAEVAGKMSVKPLALKKRDVDIADGMKEAVNMELGADGVHAMEPVVGSEPTEKVDDDLKVGS